MTCPHCRQAFHAEIGEYVIGKDADAAWILKKTTCPACNRYVLLLTSGRPTHDQHGRLSGVLGAGETRLVYPKAAMRPACPPEVPKEIAADYSEACLVLSDSAKASAALSRRCLQHLLRTAAGVKPGDLADEIQQVLDGGKLPSYLADAIDAIRNTGNFAAHPIKSRESGAVVEVEPGEAEWNLDVLEQLFDFYYVQPALLGAKRAALNKKLQELGKPPMK